MSCKGFKRKALSIEDKVKILKAVDSYSQLTKVQIAKNLNLPVTTLNGIIARKHIILNAFCSCASQKMKKVKRGKYKDIEERLMTWFEQARSASIPVNGTLLRGIALEIAEELNVDFTPSNGWIDRMKKLSGLVNNFSLSERRKKYLLLKQQAAISAVTNPDIIDVMGHYAKYFFHGQALLAKANNDEASTSGTQSDMEKRGGSSSDQKNNDPNVLPAGQCSNSTSTNLMSSSDIVIKQEIIETELESSIFDDASYHSSIADDPSEAQLDGQRPSTSYATCSESSNSNTGYILPDGQNDVVSSASTQSLISRTVKAEPDVSSNSCDVVSETNCRNESILPGVSSQIGSSSFSLSSSSHGTSWANESTLPKVPSHSNPPFRSKDRFDIFGEFVASKLRNLDSKSSAFIQTTFADLLLKAELGMFSDRNEKGVSNAQTDYAVKSTPSPNENTHGSSGKENVQPGFSSHIENTLQDFSLTQRSFRDDMQHRSSCHGTNQSSPPVANSTSSENALSNEPIQPASHMENPLPPVENVTVSENSSRTSSNQTGVSVLPSGSPILNTANSWSGTHMQPTIPFHMRPRDDFDVYGEFVASKLRNLDPRSCAFVQTAFADLIFKGELGRFVSEGEQSFFANKTNNLLWNLPSNNPQNNVVSSYEPHSRFNLIAPNICADPVPLEIVPNLHFVQK